MVCLSILSEDRNDIVNGDENDYNGVDKDDDSVDDDDDVYDDDDFNDDIGCPLLTLTSQNSGHWDIFQLQFC